MLEQGFIEPILSAVHLNLERDRCLVQMFFAQTTSGEYDHLKLDMAESPE